MSLKNKLSLAAAAAIMLVGVIITVEVFISAKSRMETGLAEQVDDMGNTFASSVNYWFNSKAAAMKAVQPDPTNEIEIVKSLQQAKVAGDFDNVFYARPDGSQLNANGVVLPPGNDDPRKWDWYQKAAANQLTLVLFMFLLHPLLLQPVSLWYPWVKQYRSTVRIQQFWVLT